MSGQRTFVTTRLVGRQLVDVNATHPKTEEARVSIKVGSTLLLSDALDEDDGVVEREDRIRA